MSTHSEEAWSAFWAAGGAGPASGCLPNALKEIDAVQARVWAAVAKGTPWRGSVLDLACGDGAVLAKIRRVRPDLKLCGIDSATKLPANRAGIILRAGVAMEALPFRDTSFDLVTSQFGIEYGDVSAAIGEVARVLRPAGRFAFLLHQADGPIVAHNKPRREALEWAIDQSDVLPRARTLVQARKIGPLPTPPLFREAVMQAQQLFPNQPVGAEFVAAVFQTLEMSRGDNSDRALTTLDELEQRGRNDIARIKSLQSAARDEGGITDLVAVLQRAGLRCKPAETVAEGPGRSPFGWLITGSR